MPWPPRNSAPSTIDRAADAGADREHDHVATAAAGAEAVLGPACGVRIVLDVTGSSSRGLELSP